MTVQKKPHHKKKKRDKATKSKQTVGSKHVKQKDLKGKKPKKHSKSKPSKGTRKKENKTPKPKLPSSAPPPEPLTAVPEKKESARKNEKEKEEENKKSPIHKRRTSAEWNTLIDQANKLSEDSKRRKKEEKDKKKEEKKEKKESDKKKEEKKEKKDDEKNEKEPKVRPAAPGSSEKTSSPKPEKKVSDLYNIVAEVSDTNSSVENIPADTKKKSEPKIVATPEATTPENEGPMMVEVKKKEGSKKEIKKEEDKKELKEEPKEGSKHGIDEMKLESDRDNLDEQPADATKKKKDGSGSKKKLKTESYKLQKTQSISPVNIAAPIVPGPPGKQYAKQNTDTNNELLMKTPPLSEKKGLVKKVDPERSDKNQPRQEPDFVQNHGDTRMKTMEIKKVDLDLVGRTGMYLERIGMTSERKSAFDWIAYNRHVMNDKQLEFSQNMAVALSDIGINKQLLMRTIVYLKSNGQIIPTEMNKVLKEIQDLKEETISFSQVSIFLKKHCETYKDIPSKEPAN